MNLGYNKLRYFAILLLVLAALSSFLSIVILPQIIVGPPHRDDGSSIDAYDAFIKVNHFE